MLYSVTPERSGFTALGLSDWMRMDSAPLTNAGCVQMLISVLPLGADSMSEVMYKIANEDVARRTLFAPRISQDLTDVVTRALSKRLETIYQLGVDFVADLHEMMCQIVSLVSTTPVVQLILITIAHEKIVEFATTVPCGAREFEKTAACQSTLQTRAKS